MLDSCGFSPATGLLFLVKGFGLLFLTLFTKHLFYFKVDILAQIGCIESLSQSPPSSSSPSPSSINKVNSNLNARGNKHFNNL